jgi:hypothetical protein
MPEPWRYRILMKRTCGFFPQQPDLGTAVATVQSANLLDMRQFRYLFPDAKIAVERFSACENRFWRYVELSRLQRGENKPNKQENCLETELETQMMWGESFASLGIVPARSKTLVFPASSGSNAGLGQAVFGAELRERLAVAKVDSQARSAGSNYKTPDQ